MRQPGFPLLLFDQVAEHGAAVGGDIVGSLGSRGNGPGVGQKPEKQTEQQPDKNSCPPANAPRVHPRLPCRKDAKAGAAVASVSFQNGITGTHAIGWRVGSFA